jgi:cell division septal protein FtsQ
MQQGLPTEPITNENGEVIMLNQDEYEAALRHFEQHQMQLDDDEDEEDMD